MVCEFVCYVAWLSSYDQAQTRGSVIVPTPHPAESKVEQYTRRIFQRVLHRDQG